MSTPFTLFGPSPGRAVTLPPGDEPTIDRLLAELREAIRRLHDAPVGSLPLVLFFSTIDTLAWLGLPQDRELVKRQDFIAWVDKYMDPTETLGCTAAEIYGARSALLHTRAATNPRRAAGVRDVWYCGAKDRLPMLREHIKQNEASAVALSGGELYKAFEDGARRFDEEAGHCPVVRARLKSILVPSGVEHLRRA